uniref:RNI-like protein n=1 Tax=Spongospora subterranea TaxID=70186 RepID=A0A0H5QPE4_9EUKA|eukprot:CRZ03918.1 hypothetical protein [Spongospora subterranea]
MGSSLSTSDHEIANDLVIDLRNTPRTSLDAVVTQLIALGENHPQNVTLISGPARIGPDAIIRLSRLMRQRPSMIAALSLTHHPISSSNIAALSLSLSSLYTLDLDNASLSESCLSSLGHGLPSANFLSTLTINDNANNLESANFTIFIEGVRSSNVLRLEMKDNKVPDVEMAEIIQGLIGSRIEHLALDGNRIGIWGSKALSQYLSLSESKIKVLGLARNRICRISSASIAAMIVQNCRLRELDLTANPMSDSGVKQVIDSLSTSSSILVLTLPLAEINQGKDVHYDSITHLLNRNRRIYERQHNSGNDGINYDLAMTETYSAA